MMRYDALNSNGYPVRTEMTTTKQILTLHVCSTDESELKEFPVDENLSQIYSTDKEKSKGITVNKCSTKDNESKSKGIIVNDCSTEYDESECVEININKQKRRK